MLFRLQAGQSKDGIFPDLFQERIAPGFAVITMIHRQEAFKLQIGEIINVERLKIKLNTKINTKSSLPTVAMCLSFSPYFLPVIDF